MDRCWLQGASGGALHAALCAAGYNKGWLLRAIVYCRLKSLSLRMFASIALGGAIPASASSALRAHPPTRVTIEPGSR